MRMKSVVSIFIYFMLACQLVTASARDSVECCNRLQTVTVCTDMSTLRCRFKVSLTRIDVYTCDVSNPACPGYIRISDFGKVHWHLSLHQRKHFLNDIFVQICRYKSVQSWSDILGDINTFSRRRSFVDPCGQQKKVLMKIENNAIHVCDLLRNINLTNGP